MADRRRDALAHATLFTRRDIVEGGLADRGRRAGEVRRGAAPPSAAWGPEAADRLVRAIGGWVNPGSLGRMPARESQRMPP